jgi:hypothetical protein
LEEPAVEPFADQALRDKGRRRFISERDLGIYIRLCAAGSANASPGNAVCDLRGARMK